MSASDIDLDIDNSDDDNDDDDDAQTEEELKSLNDRLKFDIEDYDAHVSKIRLLKSIGELDHLRNARKEFANIFPLTPELWLEWINDEKSLAESEQEKLAINELFDTAVKDYVSVDVWLEYCQFSIGGIGNPEGTEMARNIFERAISATGIHISRGYLIWEAYRELENALMLIHQQQAGITNSSAIVQKDRINTLFRRQLAIPLFDMDKTYIEYKEWLESEPVDSNIESSYRNAVEMLKQREKYENDLITLNDEEAGLADEQKDVGKRLSIYSSYLDLEFKSDSNPSRIQNLYERRITDLCLHPHVWTTYIDYIDSSLKIDSISLSVCERAARNVPNSASVWIKYLRNLERYNQPKESLLTVVEKALTRNMMEGISKYRELWLTFIDYKRRDIFKEDDKVTSQSKEELRTLFQKAVTNLAGIGADPEFQVSKYWATMEADRFRAMDEARKIWSSIMQELGDTAKHWIEYINVEKMYGDSKHLRRLFSRSLERAQDQPELISQLWLQFEREEGTLEQFEDCERKIKTRMKNVIPKRFDQQPDADNQNKKFSHFKDKKSYDKNPKSIKRKNPSEIKNQDQTFKKPKLLNPSDRPHKVAQDGHGKQSSKNGHTVLPPPGFKEVAPPPGYKKAADDAEKSESTVQKSENTVFVSNLDFSITEQQLTEFFSKSGTIKELRLVKNYAGKSKGFAYVIYSSPNEAKYALYRDKELLCGRPAYISKHDPDKKASGVGHQFQFSTGLEKNKLFVKNLPPTSTKADIEKIFAAFGILKDVRLITYRNGHSKGMAYVEFTNESNASKALVRTDNMKMGEYVLSVEISNPPARKDAQKPFKSISSLGGATKDNLDGYRGKGRSQIAFVPRSVQTNATKSKDGPESNPSNLKSGNSNADFRNMFLKDK